MKSTHRALALAITLAASTARAQDASVPAVPVPTSIEDPSGHALAAFHAALARIRTEGAQAHVLVLGDSHTAAEAYPTVLRARLQAQYGDAGRGYLVPGRPWPSYDPAGARVGMRGAWTPTRLRPGVRNVIVGLAGAALETSEANALAVVETEPGVRATRFQLHAWLQPGGGTLEVLVDGAPIATMMTASDTPQSGFGTFTTTDAPHRFEVRAVGDGPIRIFGVAVERDLPGVVVDSLGLNSARVEWLTRVEERLFRESVARRRPDLVVLAYGTNEAGDDDVPLARYEQQLRQALERVRDAAPAASIVLVGPTDRPRHRSAGPEERPRTAEIIGLQRRLAAEYGAGFFDTVAFMGGPMSVTRWAAATPPLAGTDLVHLTYRGYALLGEALFSALTAGASAAAAPVEEDAY